VEVVDAGGNDDGGQLFPSLGVNNDDHRRFAAAANEQQAGFVVVSQRAVGLSQAQLETVDDSTTSFFSRSITATTLGARKLTNSLFACLSTRKLLSLAAGGNPGLHLTSFRVQHRDRIGMGNIDQLFARVVVDVVGLLGLGREDGV
jgi:hypothetical protein